MTTLSGQSVGVSTIIFENPHLACERHGARRLHCENVVVPAGHRAGGVVSEVYDEYRRGLFSACADIVVCTELPDGTPAVLATKRAADKPFGGCWWMQGGAVHAYLSVEDFVAGRAERECGVRPQIDALIGVYCTCAEDHLAATIQPCYLGTVAYEAMAKVRTDADHEKWRLLTLSDLEALPAAECHWYPMRAFRLALTTARSAL